MKWDEGGQLLQTALDRQDTHRLVDVLDALDEAAVNFCGLLDGPANARKFSHLLYVGAEVGIIKRNKAQLQKNAPFNAMPGASSEVQLPADAKTPERLAELLV